MRMAEWFAQFKADFALNFVDEGRWRWLLEGLSNTLIITFFALLIGLAIGVVVAAIRSTYDKNRESRAAHKWAVYYVYKWYKEDVFTKEKWQWSYLYLIACAIGKDLGNILLMLVNGVCHIYLTLFRGTPIVVQLLIMYFIIFATSRNSLMVAIIAFGINSGAYVAEILRGGIMSIDNGQFEAGRSLGFNYVQTMIYIIIPQVFKNVLPTLCNEFIVLLKETSISGYVGIMDLTKAGDLIRGRTFSAFMPLIAVALIYLVMVIILSAGVGILERRLRRSER